MPGDFEQLEVYQVARESRRRAYKLARRLPAYEQYALASQMRNAADSLTSNIAEGKADGNTRRPFDSSVSHAGA